MWDHLGSLCFVYISICEMFWRRDFFTLQLAPFILGIQITYLGHKGHYSYCSVFIALELSFWASSQESEILGRSTFCILVQIDMTVEKTLWVFPSPRLGQNCSLTWPIAFNLEWRRIFVSGDRMHWWESLSLQEFRRWLKVVLDFDADLTKLNEYWWN